MTDPALLARELAEAGVAGVTVVWADNNGIPRSRAMPSSALTSVPEGCPADGWTTSPAGLSITRSVSSS